MGILDAPGLAKFQADARYRPFGNPVAFFGDSLPSYGEGFPNVIAELSMQRIQITDPNVGQNLIFSYPGQTTAYLLTKVTDITNLAVKPKVVVMNGGTNDIIGSIPLATIVSNLQAIAAAFEAAGIRVVMSTIPPLGGPFANNGKQQPARSVNVAVRHIARTTGRSLVDPYAVLVDPATQRYQSTYDSGDNTHPSGAGIYAWANKVIADLAPLFPPTPTMWELTNTGGYGANLYPDAPFQSGGGNNGGSSSAGLAAGLGCTAATVGMTPTLLADASGQFNWQRWTNGSSNSGNLYYSKDAEVLIGGHKMLAVCRSRTGQSGGTLRLTYQMYHGSQVVDLNIPLNGPSGTSALISDSAQLVYFTVPAAATNGQWQMTIPGTVGTYDFALPTVYDLTALGLA